MRQALPTSALMFPDSTPLPHTSSGELPPERLKHKWVAGLEPELAASLHCLPFSLRLSGALRRALRLRALPAAAAAAAAAASASLLACCRCAPPRSLSLAPSKLH